MIKTRISLIAVCILISFSLLSSCNIIKRSSILTILFVEDQELSVLNSVGSDSPYDSEYIRAGLLMYNTGLKTASFIPLIYSSKLSDSNNLSSVSEWIKINLALKIDYSMLLSGDSGINIYEVLDSLAEPVKIRNKSSNLLEDKDLDRWNSITKNAELFLQDEVFKHILSAAGSYIPENTIRNFISMFTDDEAEFYYMYKLVIDINSVNGYLYEHKYIQQVYSALEKSVKE